MKSSSVSNQDVEEIRESLIAECKRNLADAEILLDQAVDKVSKIPKFRLDATPMLAQNCAEYLARCLTKCTRWMYLLERVEDHGILHLNISNKEAEFLADLMLEQAQKVREINKQGAVSNTIESRREMITKVVNVANSRR